MGKLAETLIKANEGMGYVPCYQLPAFFSFFLLITFCGLLVTATGMTSGGLRVRNFKNEIKYERRK